MQEDPGVQVSSERAGNGHVGVVGGVEVHIRGQSQVVIQQQLLIVIEKWVLLLLQVPVHGLLLREADSSRGVREEALKLRVTADGEVAGYFRAQLDQMLPEPQPHVLAAVGVGLNAWPKPLVCFVQPLKNKSRQGRGRTQQGCRLCHQFLKIQRRNVFISSINILEASYVPGIGTHSKCVNTDISVEDMVVRGGRDLSQKVGT